MQSKEWEEHLTEEHEKSESFKRKLNELRLRDRDSRQNSYSGNNHPEHYNSSHNNNDSSFHSPNKSQHSSNNYNSNSPNQYFYHGMNNDTNNTSTIASSTATGTTATNPNSPKFKRIGGSSSQSVASLGSEFAQRARSLVDVMSCMNAGARDRDLDNRSKNTNERKGRGSGGSGGLRGGGTVYSARFME